MQMSSLRLEMVLKMYLVHFCTNVRRCHVLKISVKRKSRFKMISDMTIITWSILYLIKGSYNNTIMSGVKNACALATTCG